MNRYNELSEQARHNVDRLINHIASWPDHQEGVSSAALKAALSTGNDISAKNHAILDHMRAAQWPFRGVRHGR